MLTTACPPNDAPQADLCRTKRILALPLNAEDPENPQPCPNSPNAEWAPTDSPGLSRGVCSYELLTGGPLARQDIETKATADLGAVLVGIGADCPDFGGQGWSHAEDQRRLRGMQRIHRIASGTDYPPEQLEKASPAKGKLTVYVLDSVKATYSPPQENDELDRIFATETFPTSTHGLSVAEAILDSACGNSEECRNKFDIRYAQVMPHHGEDDEWGTYWELAAGIRGVLSDPLDKDAIPVALINLSVADVARVLKPIEPGTFEGLSKMLVLPNAAAVAQDLHAVGEQVGGPRFAVLLALAEAWCEEYTVIAAAGNEPAPAPSNEKPPSPARPVFPADMFEVSLTWSSEGLPLCRLLRGNDWKPKNLRQDSRPYPLLRAVAASDGRDYVLPISRGGELSLFAHGENVAARNPETHFEVLTGTSVAAATVTGIVARIWSMFPDRSGDDLLGEYVEPSGHPVKGDGLTGRIADLCASIKKACGSPTSDESVSNAGCMALECASEHERAEFLGEWSAKLGEYGEFLISGATNEVANPDDGVIGPQPTGTTCPPKYCGIYKMQAVVRPAENVVRLKLVSLFLFDGIAWNKADIGGIPELVGGQRWTKILPEQNMTAARISVQVMDSFGTWGPAQSLLLPVFR